ncbi:sigma-70 family RNA polymerase sigma factor [Halobacillus litoralis]|uniref:RNA polymerase sigma factor n=1 Tax=Halobacillus litoralis TaxID=45668 RepID=UPI00273EBA02|nr:sigma-70 family RNA polymerase sigma factor [Halobacillus litoralis]WLR48326.1 sigma-70 family RNA polymerase sigma factor [Halobacillus litoralis]
MPIEEVPVPQPFYENADSDVEHICECRHLEEDIKKRISTLSPKLRAVFQLSYDKQLQEKEIAQTLQITQAAVKSRLHRARQAIKGKLGKESHHCFTA